METEIFEPPDKPDWIVQAACKSTDPDAFFAGKQADKVKAICSDCPVWRECLAKALSTPTADDWGIWGGMSREERQFLRKEWAVKTEDRRYRRLNEEEPKPVSV